MKIYKPVEVLWKNGIMKELFCGNCKCILYGYDEEICPCCGSFNDMNNCITKKEEV